MYVNILTVLYIYCIITTTVYVQHLWPFLRLGDDLQTRKAGYRPWMIGRIWGYIPPSKRSLC